MGRGNSNFVLTHVYLKMCSRDHLNGMNESYPLNGIGHIGLSGGIFALKAYNYYHSIVYLQR